MILLASNKIKGQPKTSTKGAVKNRKFFKLNNSDTRAETSLGFVKTPRQSLTSQKIMLQKIQDDSMRSKSISKQFLNNIQNQRPYSHSNHINIRLLYQHKTNRIRCSKLDQEALPQLSNESRCSFVDDNLLHYRVCGRKLPTKLPQRRKQMSMTRPTHFIQNQHLVQLSDVQSFKEKSQSIEYLEIKKYFQLKYAEKGDIHINRNNYSNIIF